MKLYIKNIYSHYSCCGSSVLARNIGRQSSCMASFEPICSGHSFHNDENRAI